MSKEKHDEVLKYLKNGYNIGETAEKTGTSRGYVSKINRSLIPKSDDRAYESADTNLLSKKSLQILYNIQAVYGKNSLEETVIQLGEDFRTIFPYKYEFDLEHILTISDVFTYIIKEYKELKRIKDNIISAKNNDWIQRLVLKIWGVDPAVFALQDILLANNAVKETIIHSMSKAYIYSFKNSNWGIKYYYNKVLNEEMPIIITPNGSEFKFPIMNK